MNSISFKYTKYELSKLVKDELEKSNLSKEEFCEEFNIKGEIKNGD